MKKETEANSGENMSVYIIRSRRARNVVPNQSKPASKRALLPSSKKKITLNTWRVSFSLPTLLSQYSDSDSRPTPVLEPRKVKVIAVRGRSSIS